jgi:NAD(P)-dependent dehydrogenase (short-subunit alcohol dehydrogenase family)
MRKIEGRVAVVTGAASGIGRATALALARGGCDVALVDVDEVGAAETARAVESLGRAASVHVADVSNKDRMRAVAEEVAARHEHVHILVNNAGVGVSGTLEHQSLDDYEWIVGVNFWGVVHGCKFFIPYLKRENQGHIVNVSSVFGLIGLPSFGAYCATKFAVRGLSESLRAELRQYNIGVTSVHPGGVKTDIVRNGRVASEDFGDGANVEAVRSRAQEFFDKNAVAPELVAARIVDAIRHDKARMLVTRETYVVDAAMRLAPGLLPRLVQTGYRRLMTRMRNGKG